MSIVHDNGGARWSIDDWFDAASQYASERELPAPRRTRAGFRCCCPVHDDRRPSLDVDVRDGKVLAICRSAGCDFVDIVNAFGLRPRKDGITATSRHTRAPGATATQRGRTEPEVSVTHAARSFATAQDAVAHLERALGPHSAQWTYTDADRAPVGVIVRWDRDGGKKEIRPVSLNDGRWALCGMAVPRPLYRRPTLAAADRVYVTEGEPAAHAAVACGLVVTTSAHGSKSAAKTDWLPLAGREVVILPDHDQAGERYAADVARLALAAGARPVRIVRLVDLWAEMPVGGDLVDLVEHRGRHAAALSALHTAIESLADATESEALAQAAPAIPVFTPFPVDVLPDPIRSFVIGAAKSIGCDAAFVALPLLSALASAIGNTRRIELKRGWTEPPIVWTAIVGESGTHKTPAFKAAMKAIRKAQAQAFKEHQAALAQWETEHLRYEAELTAWKRDAAKKRGRNGDDRHTVDPPEKLAAPIARRYIVSDTTTEALAPILLGNPRGVLLARDELAGWIGSFDRYAKAGKAGADSAHWLSMHNGEALTIDRKTGIPPTIYVPSASVSIAGEIQPCILSRALGREHHENGLLARLLFAMPPRRVKRWSEAEVDAKTEEAVGAVFDQLFDLAPEVDEDGDERPRLVTLAEDGKAVWVRFFNEHAREQVNMSGDEAAAWAKLEGYVGRLALVVHLARWAAGDATLCDPARVDETSISAGVVLARWFGDEARRVYAILAESDDDRETRWLVELIQRKGGDISGRELVQATRRFPTVTDAEAALTRLVEAVVGKWVTPEQPGRGRPQARRLCLLPVYGVNVYRNPSGDTGRGNTVDVDGVDVPSNADDPPG